MMMKYGSPWSREELILALYLYCQIPFARTKASNQDVQHLAALLNRTPTAVARKLGNFGALDPVLAKQGITGLTHYSKADNAIWQEFNQCWDRLVDAASYLLDSMGEGEFLLTEDESVLPWQVGDATESSAVKVVRLCQSFFRRTVLSSYRYSCCICGIDLPQLLIASHIIPWSKRSETRCDPQNGLTLCALHDRAFDAGLLTVNPSLGIAVAGILQETNHPFAKIALADFHGRKILMPDRFLPNPDYLLWHNEVVFTSGIRE